jgi:hypothetical protein
VSGSSHSSARKARRHRLRLRIGSGGTRVCTRVAAELGGLAKGSGFNFSPQMPGFALVTQSTSKLNVAVCFCAHPQMHWSHDAPPVCLSYTIPPCGEQAQRGGCRSVRRHSTAPPHSLRTCANGARLRRLQVSQSPKIDFNVDMGDSSMIISRNMPKYGKLNGGL